MFFVNACGVEVSFGMMVTVMLSHMLLSIGCSVAMKETCKLEQKDA